MHNRVILSIKLIVFNKKASYTKGKARLKFNFLK